MLCFTGSTEEVDRLGLAKWMESEEHATLYKPLLDDWGKTLWALWTAYKVDSEGPFYSSIPDSVVKMKCFQPWVPEPQSQPNSPAEHEEDGPASPET